MEITDIRGTVTLNNGIQMPYYGLGVFLAKEGKEVENSVKWALGEGYRHIDTASVYKNEEGVGRAIRESGIDREEIFITSKVWNPDQGYDHTINSFKQSIEKLGTDYLDLYLIHWPIKDKSSETWRALEMLYREGRIRAIGVSNFLQHHLEMILDKAKIKPMVNQMEFHPRQIPQSLIDYCMAHQIQFEAWSPLMRGKVFDIEVLNALASKNKKTVAQLVLRWCLQKGVVTIPKSTRKEKIIENASIFDFIISEEDMRLIDQLHDNRRVGPHPDHFYYET